MRAWGVQGILDLGAEGLARGVSYPASHGGPRLAEGHGRSGSVQAHARHLLVHLQETEKQTQTKQDTFTNDILG